MAARNIIEKKIMLFNVICISKTRHISLTFKLFAVQYQEREYGLYCHPAAKESFLSVTCEDKR